MICGIYLFKFERTDKVYKLNNAHFVQVLKGKEKQHKGWRLETC